MRPQDGKLEGEAQAAPRRRPQTPTERPVISGHLVTFCTSIGIPPTKKWRQKDPRRP